MNTEIGHELWRPDDAAIKSLQISEFAKVASSKSNSDLTDYPKLHKWSVEHMEEFWSIFWDFASIIGEKGERATSDEMPMPGAKFFPDASLNFAENLLKKNDDSEAIIFRSEDKVKRRLTWNELHNKVSQLQQFFKSKGIKAGDRIAAMLPNMPEAIIGMLAASSLGAIWSSCSPDFGQKGILDRFGQIEPKILIACDGYWYNGKQQHTLGKVASVADELSSLQSVLIVDLLHSGNCETHHKLFSDFDACCDVYQKLPVEFNRMGFDHPLYILFSSGTTGIPKCIIHAQGGVLLKQLSEHRLHCDTKEGNRVFYFTTCGWMMWNWLVAALAAEATLLLYDGSPFYPDGNVLFDFAEQEKCNLFGTSAKFIDAVRKTGLTPIKTHNLSTVKMITSTGSPLAPENFAFVYEGISKDVSLASISGGTDIAGCFVGGVPTMPVRVGEIQCAILGMSVEVWDDDGKPISSGKGELVCNKAFPSMPVSFWNDPDNSKYMSAYFERFDGVWCHGDFAEWTENNGMIIHGRSDATLNPGGVRIGTAEIYNQVEQMSEIQEAICIGQQWDGDVRVILFVKLSENVQLDDDLQKSIKLKIRTGASPRHVPAKIIEISDIPRTKSGKITELAVRDIVHGRSVKNKEALANPQALELFKNLEELQS